jgi:hypothetical protein
VVAEVAEVIGFSSIAIGVMKSKKMEAHPLDFTFVRCTRGYFDRAIRG